MIFLRLIITTMFLSFVLPLPAQAETASSWQSADYVQARLLSAVTGTKNQDQLTAAVDIRLSDGWHAYWRMPGEGGLPPSFDWSQSRNVDNVRIKWPAPTRFKTLDMYSFGYDKSVLLPLAVDVKEPGTPVKLMADAQIMVCKDICVPQKLTLSLMVGADEARPSSQKPRIDAALKRVPVPDKDVTGLSIENVVLGKNSIVATVFARDGAETAELLVEIEGAPFYMTAKPEIIPVEGDDQRVLVRVAIPDNVDDAADALADKTVTMTLIKDRTAIEKTVTF